MSPVVTSKYSSSYVQYELFNSRLNLELGIAHMIRFFMMKFVHPGSSLRFNTRDHIFYDVLQVFRPYFLSGIA